MTSQQGIIQQNQVDELKETVRNVLQQAKKLGATQAAASSSFGMGLSVTVRMRNVETLEYHRDQGLGVTVFFGQRKGSASTSDLTPGAISETVKKACSLARYTAEDDCAGLADADRMARDIPDLDLWYPWSLEPAAAIELATQCEAAALDTESRISNSEGATVGTQQSLRVYGNSHGFLEGCRETQHSLSCAVIAAEDGQMERDYEYSVARRAGDLTEGQQIGREAAERAVRRLGSVKLDTRSTPVLYPARLARGLIGHLIGAISGGSLYRKATFLLDSLDTRVFSDCVRIEELPHLPGALGSSSYDSEGVATADRMLVEDGVLKGFVLGSYYARKLGAVTTGNAGGVHNLVVSDTGHSPEGLLKMLDTGFLVTELMGSGVNIVTGDYSMGAAGFWVEQGTVQFPVSEVTIAGNLKDMYRNIVAVGTDTDCRGRVRTGSILVEGMTLAGN